jgi:hypothetical protein
MSRKQLVTLTNMCMSENILISVLAFFIFRRKIMQKNEQSSRQIVMCHLMAIMGIDIEKAKRI